MQKKIFWQKFPFLGGSPLWKKINRKNWHHSASTCHQVICPCLGIMFRQNVLASWWQRSRQWKSSVISVHTYLASVHTYPASVHTYPASWGKISAVSETQVALGVWWQTDMKGRGGGTESVELTEICNYQYMYA